MDRGDHGAPRPGGRRASPSCASCPNSLELPLDRLGALPQVGLAAATAASILLMNYGSKFLYFQF